MTDLASLDFSGNFVTSALILLRIPAPSSLSLAFRAVRLPCAQSRHKKKGPIRAQHKAHTEDDCEIEERSLDDSNRQPALLPITLRYRNRCLLSSGTG